MQQTVKYRFVFLDKHGPNLKSLGIQFDRVVKKFNTCQQGMFPVATRLCYFKAAIK